ncbi:MULTISPECIES: STAS domain-containing protein [unclassified Rhizobacter]|uniref:STAS domain-containing protein n=1 Tax=unclassified Rhizobacter TaxID=2640088 RepID=UPI0006F9DAA6|nr:MULTISPECIES: STAS domain-containing protein [unclassified Rhizobacter]KQU73459.1 polyvinylalcohol dehydrogenase [Rhizobacter sp. Root29]KQV98644.1 polyvinylalcohol dehydrogenase [Rhizobacter sp. Root1238]KRB04897.1 polyvinylalcohol dehydrogenase [Rhizobacter sp. Root16D2]
MRQENSALDHLLSASGSQVLAEWQAEYGQSGTQGGGDVKAETSALLKALHAGLRADGDPSRLDVAAWDGVRDVLAGLSRSRAAQGASAENTSQLVLSVKKPLFSGLQATLAARPQELVAAVWAISTLVDKMAQFTMSTYQRTREEVILRQQQELLELSTPVVKLWDGVLAVPMIGTLDSSRTQLVMESLLQRIVETGSEIAIIDITGVPTVDTLVAQHLLKTVTAIRLMGADCIISGVRPQIAQTIVHLGINLQGITTKATLADALALAIKSLGFSVGRTKA